MMIVSLLPLFLAANVAVNVGDWKYGPEVIYNAEVNAVSNTTDPEVHTHIYNMTVKLKCRPKSELILSCHFNDSKTMLTVFETDGNSSNPKISGEVDDDTMGSDIFELNFHRGGLEEIVVSSSINPVKLDMIRALVLQLNIGTDLTAQSMNNFDVMEDSSAGECRTSYVMEKNRVEKSGVKDEKKKTYEVVILPGLRLPSGDIGQIQRTRNVDDCRYPINYFFGSREAHRENSTIDIKLISSMSQMTITRNDFTSFTESEVHVKDNRFETDASSTINERITVSLDKIVPASGPFPKIDDPSSASILPTKWLYGDSSEEEEEGNDFKTQFVN